MVWLLAKLTLRDNSFLMQLPSFLSSPFKLLQIATVSVFAARGWQHLYWDAPYRTLLWDERWMKGIVESVFGLSWSDYVSDLRADAAIDAFTRGMGCFYILCAICAIMLPRWKRIASWALIAGSVGLFFLAFLYTKEKFFFAGEFLEYALQFSTPVFLVWLYRMGEPSVRFLNALKIAIALTFTAHGLYAVGFYPRPANFIEMTMKILYLSQQDAISFLKIVGTLDFVVSICIFLPWRKPVMIALTYAALWGLATALARTWAYFIPYFWANSLAQWLHETVMRLPHALVPLVVWVCVAKYLVRGTKARV